MIFQNDPANFLQFPTKCYLNVKYAWKLCWSTIKTNGKLSSRTVTVREWKPTPDNADDAQIIVINSRQHQCCLNYSHKFFVPLNESYFRKVICLMWYMFSIHPLELQNVFSQLLFSHCNCDTLYHTFNPLTASYYLSWFCFCLSFSLNSSFNDKSIFRFFPLNLFNIFNP